MKVAVFGDKNVGLTHQRRRFNDIIVVISSSAGDKTATD
jgi:hypothetical protein